MTSWEMFWLKCSNGESTEPPKKPGCELCRGSELSKQLFSVCTHEGKTVVCTFKYCPVCGRKLPSYSEKVE